MDKSFSRAQGTIEYLVIIAIIVVIGLVVVSLVSQIASGPVSNASEVGTELNARTGSVSVLDAVVDSNGEAILSLMNNTSRYLSVTKIRSGSEESLFDNAQIAAGDGALIALDNVGSTCACSLGEVGRKLCVFTIYVTSAEGIKNTYEITKNVDCVNDVVAADVPKVILQTGSTPPTVTLSYPDNNSTIKNFNFEFTVTGPQDINKCNLLIDNVVAASVGDILSPTRGVTKIAYLRDLSLTAASHTWNVTCVDSMGNSAVGSQRIFTNPFTSFGTVSACGATYSVDNAYYWISQQLNGSPIPCINVTANNVGIDGGQDRYGMDSNIFGSPTLSGGYMYLSNFSLPGGVVGGSSSLGGKARSLVLYRMNVGAIDVSVTQNSNYYGPGGDVNAYYSQLSSITSEGGDIIIGGGGCTGMPPAGNGGNLVVNNSSGLYSVNLSGGTRGGQCQPVTYGVTGTLYYCNNSSPALPTGAFGGPVQQCS